MMRREIESVSELMAPRHSHTRLVREAIKICQSREAKAAFGGHQRTASGISKRPLKVLTTIQLLTNATRHHSQPVPTFRFLSPFPYGQRFLRQEQRREPRIGLFRRETGPRRDIERPS